MSEFKISLDSLPQRWLLLAPCRVCRNQSVLLGTRQILSQFFGISQVDMHHFGLCFFGIHM